MSTLDIEFHKNNLFSKGYTSFTLDELISTEFKNKLRKTVYKDDMTEMNSQFNKLRFDCRSELTADEFVEICEKYNLLARKSDIENLIFGVNHDNYQDPPLFKYQTHLEFSDTETHNSKLDEERISKFHNFLLEIKDKLRQVSQIWYYSETPRRDEENELVNEIWKKVFDVFYSDKYSIENTPPPPIQKTRYGLGCSLEPHEDGAENNNIFALLIYLNNRYDKSEGGYLTLGSGEDSIDVEPHIGNIAIIDFTKHDPEHAVSEVTSGDGRYAFLTFVSNKEKIIYRKN